MAFKDIKDEEELLKYLNAPLSNSGWSSAYHYTSLETLFQIFKNKSLKVSRMNQMNDLLEYNFARDCKDYYFCLSKGKKDAYENFGMWAMYGNIKNPNKNKLSVNEYAKNMGVKIYFPKYVLENFIKQTSGVSLRLIGYADFVNKTETKKVRISSSGKTLEIRPDNRFFGYLKDNSWSYEKEIRICLSDEYKDKYEHNKNCAYLPFSEELLDDLEVYPSPLYSEEQCKECFEKLKGSENIKVPKFLENKYRHLYQDLKTQTKQGAK